MRTQRIILGLDPGTNLMGFGIIKKTEKSLKKILLDFNSTADGYKKVKKIILLSEDWTPENGLTTPTLKIKRAKIDEAFSAKYQNWYNASEEVLWE